MKKTILGLVLIFTAGIVFGQTTVPAIVVSTFSTRGQAVTADDAESITELFIAELAQQSGVRVIDRTSLDRVIAEMRFQASDWSDSQKTSRLGAALNAEFLVRGQINQLGQQISVAITALDIKTLEVVSSSTETFDVNRIYDTSDTYSNIFYKMRTTMAFSIANQIKTKMTQLAEQRQKDQEERERQQQQNVAFANLPGTWRAQGAVYNSRNARFVRSPEHYRGRPPSDPNIFGNNQLFITFLPNGTLTYYADRCGQLVSGGGFEIIKVRIEGSGYWERDGDKLNLNLTYRIAGTRWEAQYVSGVIPRYNTPTTSSINENGNRNGQITIILSQNGRTLELRYASIFDLGNGYGTNSSLMPDIPDVFEK